VEEIVSAIVRVIFRGVVWLIMELIGDVVLEGLIKAIKRTFRAFRPRRVARAAKVSLEKDAPPTPKRGIHRSGR
jgi:hypothetical protein